MRLSSTQVVCSVNCVVNTVRVIEHSANNRGNHRNAVVGRQGIVSHNTLHVGATLIHLGI